MLPLPKKSLPGRQVLYFENIFLLWLRLSILISKALPKEMAAGRDLSWHSSHTWLTGFLKAPGEGAEKGQQGREETHKKGRGARELWEGQGLFSQPQILKLGWKEPINPNCLSCPYHVCAFLLSGLSPSVSRKRA